jgi:hypothetical protein
MSSEWSAAHGEGAQRRKRLQEHDSAHTMLTLNTKELTPEIHSQID